MSRVMRAGTAPGHERAHEICEAFGMQVTRRVDLLHECCVWRNSVAFQRLEFLGDAFLQCAPSASLLAHT
eukprot:1435092-Prymnesium_polylepis.1